MKYIYTTIIILLFCININAQKNDNTPEIAILGTFHFGATLDQSAIIMDSIMEPKRQQEIKDLVNMLATFKPTKILVEYPFTESESLINDYQSYLSDKRSLSVNEIDQIGFRLAEKLGHEKLYGIDHRIQLPFNSVMEYLQDHNQMDRFKMFIEKINGWTTNETKKLATMSLSEYLYEMNTDRYDVIANELYLTDIIDLGDTDNEAGAEVTAIWYKRNMIMTKYIAEVSESGDRILVILGQAHRAVIKNLINNRSDLHYVEIGDFLKN